MSFPRNNNNNNNNNNKKLKQIAQAKKKMFQLKFFVFRDNLFSKFYYLLN